MADVAKRLSFGDLSVPLSHHFDADRTSDLAARVANLASALESLGQSVDDGISQANKTAVHQVQVTGGRQILKRQIQSLKASILNLGQKEFFSEALKTLRVSDPCDYKSEADRAAAAVESAEEDLKDLKKINDQDEQQLRQAIQTIAAFYDQYQTAAARVSQKIALSAKELEAHEATKPPPMSPILSGPSEADCEAQLAHDGNQALALESKLAAAHAECADMEAAIQAQQDDIAIIQAEIAHLNARKTDKAKKAETTCHTSLQWCEAMLNILSNTSGVTVLGIHEDTIQVQLRQHIPLTLGDIPGTESRVVEHSLTMHLQPSSSKLKSARLEPASVDIADEIEYAKWNNGSLPIFLNSVRAKLRDFWSREALIEEAAKNFTIMKVSATQPVIRAVLPNCVEVEVTVPYGWPSNADPLQLLTLQSPSASMNLTSAEQRIRQGQTESGRSSLKAFLESVLAAVEDARP